jgi:DNA-binding transcriptional LysR family regulator
MLKLSLEAIELVDAIARYGSFAGASERLHKVPSTISYAVGKLEEQLGLALSAGLGPAARIAPAADRHRVRVRAAAGARLADTHQRVQRRHRGL